MSVNSIKSIGRQQAASSVAVDSGRARWTTTTRRLSHPSDLRLSCQASKVKKTKNKKIPIHFWGGRANICTHGHSSRSFFLINEKEKLQSDK